MHSFRYLYSILPRSLKQPLASNSVQRCFWSYGIYHRASQRTKGWSQVYYLLERERERVSRAKGRGRGESQADSMQSTEPQVGLDPRNPGY